MGKQTETLVLGVQRAFHHKSGGHNYGVSVAPKFETYYAPRPVCLHAYFPFL